jgi:hypothetical protein
MKLRTETGVELLAGGQLFARFGDLTAVYELLRSLEQRFCRGLRSRRRLGSGMSRKAQRDRNHACADNSAAHGSAAVKPAT